MNKKPIVLWPGDKRQLDGSEEVIYISNAILMGVIGLVLGLMSFFIYWNNFPGLPLPKSSASPFFHFKGGLLVLLSHISPLFQTSSYDGYLRFIASINQPDSSDLTSLALRWCLTLITTAAMSIWFFMLGYKPISSIKQVRGKKKLEGSERPAAPPIPSAIGSPRWCPPHFGGHLWIPILQSSRGAYMAPNSRPRY